MNQEEIRQLFSSISWVFSFVLALIFAAVSLALNYHWTKYEIHKDAIERIRKIYLGVAGAFWLLMLGALAALFIFA